MKKHAVWLLAWMFCGFCGLVARGEERGALALVAAQPASSNVLSATGRVQALTSARISPRVSGHLIELGPDAQGRPLDAGMPVTKGQVLFKLNETTFQNTVASATAGLASAQAALDNLTAKTRDEQLEQLRQAVAELDARLADKQRDEARYQRLVEEDKTAPPKRLEEVRTDLAVLKAQHAAAAARLAEAENGPTKTEIALAAARVLEAQALCKTAQDDLRDATVRAPFAGLIVRRMKGPGDYIAANPPTEVLELVSLEALEVEFHLPEAYFVRVQAGVTAVKLSSDLLKEGLAAKVTRVVGDIDATRGTFVCRVAVPPGTGLVPGAFVTGEMQLDAAGGGVIVPQRAVRMGGQEAAVFVARGGKMVRQVVELGDRLTEGVIVKAGLASGEQVLVGPGEALRDGAELPGYLKASGR